MQVPSRSFWPFRRRNCSSPRVPHLRGLSHSLPHFPSSGQSRMNDPSFPTEIHSHTVLRGTELAKNVTHQCGSRACVNHTTSNVPRTVLWKMEIGEGRGRTSISTSKWRRESTWWVEIDKKSQSIGSEALRRHTMCSNSNRMQSCRRVVQQQNMSL